VPIDPDWKEAEAPPPPALRTSGLIPLELPHSSLSFGVDPASIAIGADGIVRYVVVASSPSGAVNALYEGIRCPTGETRTYARYNPGSGWVAASTVEWRRLQEASTPGHTRQIARNGVCIGGGTNHSVAAILRDLKGSADSRFRN
jgi:hypothetical protein